MPHPFHPIIYVRGFAGTQGEIEDTVADPYMGFNIGSAKCRQAWDGSMRKFFFESPLVRLIEEYGYRDVYSLGLDQVMDANATEAVPYKSVVIYRYYETASEDLGTGKLPAMEDFARGLAELILKLRDRVAAGKEAVPPADFRVYLVAHSMGGLVCRSFLQKSDLGRNPAEAARIKDARTVVDKLFTYATPHNGIDMRLIGNVPGWFNANNTSDFNRDRMAVYLDVQDQYNASGQTDVSFIKNIDPDRVFNLVGTNAHDYSVLKGISRFGAGEISDGLVRVENATTWGEKDVPNSAGKIVPKRVNSPRAFVHRSHSGYFGIVNSEEGYQNMTRFFFGDFRVDGVLEVKSFTLPDKVVEKAAGRPIDCAYYIETIVSVRGALWQMHRRTNQENSASLIRGLDADAAAALPAKTPHVRHGLVVNGPVRKQLFSTFLSQAKSHDKETRTGGAKAQKSRSVSFAVDLRVLVPEYEIDNKIFFDTHYEGGYLYRDRLYIVARPAPAKPAKWQIFYAFESHKPSPSEEEIAEPADATLTPEGGLTFTVPIVKETNPGLSALLRVTTRPWNRV